MILSILIPSIPERAEMLAILLDKLASQVKYCQNTHPTLGEFEIIADDGEAFLKGGKSIGAKRQDLLDAAKGAYVCFLDDDEGISPDYLETLLRLCKQDKDVCTFRSIAKIKDFWGLVDMSLHNATNDDLSPEKLTRRTPWHISPVRSTFAKAHKFPDTNYGEDYEWFSVVLKHCFNEAHTDRIIHEYNHGKHSEADKIFNHV